MVTILKGKASLQIKFGLSYILIIVVVLVILNTYPLLASENLVFRTKETSVSASVKMVESALSGLDRLTEESVRQALDGLEETGVSRILVTDTAGRVLYDTRETESAVGSYAFYTEIEQALEGYDAFSSRYDGAAFLSRGASPVVYRNETIGAVCAYEYDTVQAGMLRNFQSTLMKISAAVAALVMALSYLLSRMLTRRISDLLQAIRKVREGAYSHRAAVRGSDEIAQIADGMLRKVAERMKDMEISMTWTEAAKKHLAKAGFDPVYGARPLRRAVTNEVEDLVAEESLEGKIAKGSEVVLDVENDKLVLKTKGAETKAE